MQLLFENWRRYINEEEVEKSHHDAPTYDREGRDYYAEEEEEKKDELLDQISMQLIDPIKKELEQLLTAFNISILCEDDEGAIKHVNEIKKLVAKTIGKTPSTINAIIKDKLDVWETDTTKKAIAAAKACYAPSGGTALKCPTLTAKRKAELIAEIKAELPDVEKELRDISNQLPIDKNWKEILTMVNKAIDATKTLNRLVKKGNRKKKLAYLGTISNLNNALLAALNIEHATWRKNIESKTEQYCSEFAKSAEKPAQGAIAAAVGTWQMKRRLALKKKRREKKAPGYRW